MTPGPDLPRPPTGPRVLPGGTSVSPLTCGWQTPAPAARAERTGSRVGLAPQQTPDVRRCATVRAAPALCRGGTDSAKSGRIPALSRNGEASRNGGEPRRLTCVTQPVLGGRAVRSAPHREPERAHFVLRASMEDDHVQQLPAGNRHPCR